MKNRIGIYFFYDKDGIMDNYVFYFLDALKKITERIVFVVNGFIKQEYMDRLNTITNEILIRENKGYDAYAYKYAFDYVGWSNLLDYDEVVYCNSTFFGPIYPLEEMFLKMEEKVELDFWGITQHPDYLADDDNIPAYHINPYGYLPKHIQHYFMVYRRKFIKSKELYDFWNNLPEINDYFDTVGLFETVFTKYFADLGFKWDAYIKYENNENINYPLLYKPYDVAKKYMCPIIKRKSFYLENDLTKVFCTKEQINKLIKYITENNLYNVDLIKDNIERIKKN